MMTAFAVNELIKEAEKESICRIFDKPLDMSDVINFLDKSKINSFVLIIDDDPNVCEILRDVLNFKGYKVAIKNSGKNAIEFARENSVDVTLIDIRMPALNGLETYVELKKNKPDIHAVMMTGFRIETQDIVKKAMDQNAYSCLYKPLDMDKVIDTVNQLTKV